MKSWTLPNVPLWGHTTVSSTSKLDYVLDRNAIGKVVVHFIGRREEATVDFWYTRKAAWQKSLWVSGWCLSSWFLTVCVWVCVCFQAHLPLSWSCSVLQRASDCSATWTTTQRRWRLSGSTSTSPEFTRNLLSTNTQKQTWNHPFPCQDLVTSGSKYEAEFEIFCLFYTEMFQFNYKYLVLSDLLSSSLM